MHDLELARLRLKAKKLSLVVKNGKVIFEAKSHGVKGFLEAIELVDRETNRLPSG